MDDDDEVHEIFNERRFIRTPSDAFEFPPPPPQAEVSSPNQNAPLEEDEDSIFGEESEHVDEFPPTPAGGQIQRTNSITFNIKKGNYFSQKISGPKCVSKC